MDSANSFNLCCELSAVISGSFVINGLLLVFTNKDSHTHQCICMYAFYTLFSVNQCMYVCILYTLFSVFVYVRKRTSIMCPEVCVCM